MEKILIYIKHHFASFWKIVELGNDLVFYLLYNSKVVKVFPDILDKYACPYYTYRKLGFNDAEALVELISKQGSADLLYFKPHGFDIKAIRNQFCMHSFLPMGVYEDDKMIGYFFLRFFINKKCFVGRIIDKPFRGQGIGNVMNDILYNIAWAIEFRCMSTISSRNKAVMKAHSSNSSMVVLKEIKNSYLLVEFVKRPKVNNNS